MAIRNFTWHDLPDLVQFTNSVRASQGDDRSVSLSSLKEELSLPGLSPEDNCFLFEDQQGLLAYYLLHPELRIGRTVLELTIHPAHAEMGIEKQIVKSALNRSETLKARVLHVCISPSDFWGALLENEGFSKVRSYLLMWWEGREVPTAEPPEGFAIESFRRGHEEKLTTVQNNSFEGSWGFCPNTVEEVSYRAGMAESLPEGILFLNYGDEAAGYCWTCIRGEPPNHVGIIGMIGIDPRYRGRGLSRPILIAGMDYLQSRGVKYIMLDVDGENSPAIGLYTSVGFKKGMELHWFEAPLPEL